MSDLKPSRRLSRQLDDLPGLFDDIDISRRDIAGDIIARATAAPAKSPAPEIGEIDVDSLAPRKSLRFMSFGSGSSGNCCYIGCQRGGILVDAGVDGKFVAEQLLRNGIDLSAIKGILLTHDHGDHIKYAYSILRANRHMRLFCTPKTLNGILRRHNISRRIKDYHSPIFKEFPFELAGMTVTAFEVSHDGTDNVGFTIECDGLRFSLVTDTGYVTERADYYLRQSNAVMIEANYDAEMLRNGPYSEHLKARIASQIGHLDNSVTAAYLASVVSQNLSHVFLCHLSHDNNYPEIALAAVTGALEAAGAVISDHPLSPGVSVNVLPRFATSPLFVINKTEL